MMHPRPTLIILWRPLSKLHRPISSISASFFHQWVIFWTPYFGKRGSAGVECWVSLVASACGSPSHAGQPALGGRIHQPRQTIRPDETLSSPAPTLRCPRWNIIIVRVKNDPGATGALMELLPHRWSTNTRDLTLDILKKLFLETYQIQNLDSSWEFLQVDL